MKQNTVMLSALTAMLLLLGCKDKPQLKDTAEYVDNYEIPRPGAPKALVQPAVREHVRWQGKPCVVSIVCRPVDTVMVYDEFGQAYKDNAFEVRLLQGDSTVVMSTTLTRQQFLQAIADKHEQQTYSRLAVLRSVTAETGDDGSLQHLNVSLQKPDAVDDDNLLFRYFLSGAVKQVNIDYMPVAEEAAD